MGVFAVCHKVGREGLSGKLALDQKPEGTERVSHAGIGGGIL